MADTTIKKIDGTHSPRGEMGQKYLVCGTRIALRKWEETTTSRMLEPHRRPYETVGYVLGGLAELEIEGQTVLLQPGDSWLVPRNAVHAYRVLDTFTAIEATSPPARVHERDASPGGVPDED